MKLEIAIGKKSGTTLKAAKELNRKRCGIEINPEGDTSADLLGRIHTLKCWAADLKRIADGQHLLTVGMRCAEVVETAQAMIDDVNRRDAQPDEERPGGTR